MNHQSNQSEKTMKTMNAQSPSPKSFFRRVFSGVWFTVKWGSISALLVALVYFKSMGTFGPDVRPVPEVSEADHDQEVARRVGLRVAEITREYRLRQEAAVTVTRQKINEILEAAAAQADARGWADTAPMRGVGNVSACIMEAAKDQVFGSTDLQWRVTQSIQPTVKLLAETGQLVEIELRALVHAMEAIANDYRAATLQFVGSIENEEIHLDFPKLEGFQQAWQDACGKTLTATISGTIEVLLISSSIKCIRSVVGHLIARQAGSLAAGATCVAADGPLPIGDIIGAIIVVGGAAWTACEIQAAAAAIEQLAPALANEIRGETTRIRGISEEVMTGILRDSNELFASPQIAVRKPARTK